MNFRMVKDQPLRKLVADDNSGLVEFYLHLLFMALKTFLDILPVEIAQTILRFACGSALPLETSPEAIRMSKREDDSRNQHFVKEIRSSWQVKWALSLVSRRMHVLVEGFLLEAIIVTEWDKLPSFVEFLRFPSAAIPSQTRGDRCRRLDFSLGRRGHYWCGEGHLRGFKDLWGILPLCRNLEMLIIDPWMTEYRPSPTLQLPEIFWDKLVATCAHSLRLLSIAKVEIDPRHSHKAAQSLRELQCLEIKGGWYGDLVETNTPIQLQKLHYLEMFGVDTFLGVEYPALNNAFILTADSIHAPYNFASMTPNPELLTHLSYYGPPMDIFSVCDTYVNLRQLTIHYLRRVVLQVIPWVQNGRTAPSLETLVLLCYHHEWPAAQPLLVHIRALHLNGAFPRLRKLHYKEHRDSLNTDTTHGGQGTQELISTFKTQGIELIMEKRILSLD